MLRIKQVKSYKLPRYPRGPYYERPDTLAWKIAASIASVALVLLVSSCEPGEGTVPPTSGVVGPPPMPPEMVTEKEARTVINEVFARNGINLEADVPFPFYLGGPDTYNLEMDGFNRDLNIGYEYITGDDNVSFTPEVVGGLEAAAYYTDNGPYIKTIVARQFFSGPGMTGKDIENVIEDFIADLRSRGIIENVQRRYYLYCYRSPYLGHLVSRSM